jgi:hypothetical protein
LRISKYFKLPDLSASRSRFRIPGAVEIERYHFFSGNESSRYHLLHL